MKRVWIGTLIASVGFACGARTGLSTGRGANGGGAPSGSATTASGPSTSSSPTSSSSGESCAPGATRACYDGPAGTEGVGACIGGTQTCAADGSGFGDCVGQVTPMKEDCKSAIDEDCDGAATCSGNILWQRALPMQPFGVVSDKNGNIFVGGWAKSGADFGDGVVLTGGGPWAVAKLDPSGKALWAHFFASDQGAVAIGRRVLATDGENIFLGGDYGATGAFLDKLTNEGDVVWAKQSIGKETSNSGPLATDAAGNVYFFAAGKEPALNSGFAPGYSGAILAFDAKGNFMRGVAINHYPGDFTVDAAGRITVYGTSVPGIDDGLGCSSSLHGGFVATIDPKLGCSWFRQDLLTGPGAVASDAAGVHLLLALDASTDFGGGFLDPTGEELAMASYAPSGGYAWASLLGGSTLQAPSIASGPGGIAMFAVSDTPVSFAGAMLAGSPRTLAVMRAAYDGSQYWAHASPGDSNAIYGAVDPSGNVIATGGSNVPVDFGAGPIANFDHGFLVKFSP